MQTSQENIQYDYAFIGAGASTILTLLSLEHHQLLQNKKIIIFDPEQKNRNDRTFCFWGTKNEINLQQILPLVSKKWNNIAVNQIDTPNPQEIEYYHIRGIDIYKQLDRLIDCFQIERSFSKVNSIKEIEEHVALQCETQQWLSKIAFDSRPPTFATPQNNESLLYQTFWGLNVVLENPRFDSNTIDLMDFNVPQNNQTQFVYVLPYNQSSALVELTRFGKEKIEAVEATNILNQYIQERFGNFQIIDTEEGCIPMCTSPLNDVSESKNIIKIGANAGAIKPSTGYAFKTMLKHANEIGKKLASKELPPKIASKNRFQLYDRLLLKIIEEKPLISKSIFEKLFLKNNTSVILNFLEEKTTLKEDVKIFSTLPFFTFFRALIYDLTSNIKHELTVLFFTMGLLALFLRGIPHGALDHLLEAKQINGTPKLSFILKYLLLSFLYLLAWFYIPNISFLFFIVFSIWHFGSTDIHEWKIRGFANLKSWIWGTLIFTLILCGHTLETNEIIQKMNVTMPTISLENGQFILIIGIIISIIFSIYNRKKGLSLIVISLILSAKLPLLTSFGIYFLGQHSINGWSHLRSGLNTSNGTMMKKSLPFTLGAFFLFIVLGISQKFNLYHFNTKNMVSLAFIFIACISFPHVVAMNVFYKGKKA